MPLNCPQAVSKLKAYQKQHQKLQTIFDDLLSQVPFLPDVKWDEPFMSSPYYKDITNAKKEIFDNLYDAKEDARKKLEELKEISGYNEILEEKQFFKLTWNKKLESIYSRCFKPTQYPNQELQYQQPIPDLRRHELEFLYDNYRNEKMALIISHRDKNADMLKIFDCAPNQIVHNQQELEQALKDKREIKVYVGELFPNIFKLLPNATEGIYMGFPGIKIKKTSVKLGVEFKTTDDFIKAIENRGGFINSSARDIMSKPEFVFSEKDTEVRVVILSVGNLGFSNNKSIEEIINRAKELGLEPCPPDIGPKLCIQNLIQEKKDGSKDASIYCVIAMAPITNSKNELRLFDVIIDNEDYINGLTTDSGSPSKYYRVDYPFAFVHK